MSGAERKYLNLGCGTRIHPAWTNVDVVAYVPGVMEHDLSRGVPFGDASFDVVYHSHVLEHIPREQAPEFIAECRRVLKPGGVLRVAVPDLEGIARAYISALDAAANGAAGAEADHAWMTMELLDQAVRTRSGGEMAKYLSQATVENREFVVSRVGAEARRWLDRTASQQEASPPPRPLWRRALSRARRLPTVMRRRSVELLLGTEAEALTVGRFRTSGEVHHWMYDRVSLGRLLERCGFVEVTRRGAAESFVDGWSGFNLDTEADGTVYKPDSLFMEGRKPR